MDADGIDRRFEPPGDDYTGKRNRRYLTRRHADLRRERDAEWTRLIDSGETPEAVGQRFGYTHQHVTMCVKDYRIAMGLAGPLPAPSRLEQVAARTLTLDYSDAGNIRDFYSGAEPTNDELDLMRGWYYGLLMRSGLTVDDLARLGGVTSKTIYKRLNAYRETVRWAEARIRDAEEN